MPTARGTTLWSLVNRTKSRVGRQALRERLLNPPHTADEILALQRAHQVLAADAKAYRDTLDRAAADNIERYLNATWQLPRDMPPLIRFRKWYRQYLLVQRAVLAFPSASIRSGLLRFSRSLLRCASVRSRALPCRMSHPARPSLRWVRRVRGRLERSPRAATFVATSARKSP